MPHKHTCRESSGLPVHPQTERSQGHTCSAGLSHSRSCPPWNHTPLKHSWKGTAQQFLIMAKECGNQWKISTRCYSFSAVFITECLICCYPSAGCYSLPSGQQERRVLRKLNCQFLDLALQEQNSFPFLPLPCKQVLIPSTSSCPRLWTTQRENHLWRTKLKRPSKHFPGLLQRSYF